MVMDVLQWSRHYRCFPGQGGLDVAAVVRGARDAGYRGPLSLEVFNDVFRAADPERMAVDAMRSLLILEDELPPPAALDGYAFVELGLDSTCAPETEATLEALGFTHTGQHRSKPVQLWEQGGRARGRQPRRGAGQAARRRAGLRDARPGGRRGAGRGAAGADPARAPAPGRGARCARSSRPTGRR